MTMRQTRPSPSRWWASIQSIIEKAREYDSPGNRVRKLREMFLEALGLTTNQDDFFLPYTFVWRGTRRTCDVL